MANRMLVSGCLALLLSSCGIRHYRLQVDGRSDLLTPPIRSGEPISSLEAHRRVYGPHVRNGYIDLREGMHLKVVAPAVRGGGEIETNVVSQVQEGPSTITLTVESNVTGWETAYYVVERRAWNGTVSLRFLSGESSVEGERKPMPAPNRARISIPEGFSMLRLFYRRGMSDHDHDAGIVAASNEQALAEAAARLEQSCEGPPSLDFECLRITDGVSINPVVGVRANWQMRYLPLGARLSGLLRTADDLPPGAVPPNLNVRRRFRNSLARVRYDPAAILGLVLIDGDRIEW